ncbi:MAG TPA: VTT domain-containing protein [Terriglobales bacterium]|nr:VTT domain-containing protein [Terriglobales bacterium]
MLKIFTQSAQPRRARSLASMFRHLGALGLFSLAIVDSSPLPTAGGPDILTAILAASHRDPWYEYAAVATAGSVLGAYLTFRIGRQTGWALLHRKSGDGKVSALVKAFHQWGAGALAVSVAVPLPFPTSVFFVAAGASNYSTSRYLAIVTICRAARYAAIAVVADHYGRHFIRALRHPMQYWVWLLLLVAIILALVGAGVLINRRLGTLSAAEQTLVRG